MSGISMAWKAVTCYLPGTEDCGKAEPETVKTMMLGHFSTQRHSTTADCYCGVYMNGSAAVYSSLSVTDERADVAPHDLTSRQWKKGETMCWWSCEWTLQTLACNERKKRCFITACAEDYSSRWVNGWNGGTRRASQGCTFLPCLSSPFILWSLHASSFSYERLHRLSGLFSI